MKLITIDDLTELIQKLGITQFSRMVLDTLESDFLRWSDFEKSPRHAIQFPNGVIELMPCADDSLYSFKYVNGHPKNTFQGKLSVIAVGMLAEVDTGFPLMLCEMTLATAFRTAATTALGAKYLARKNSRHVAIIGTGAQAEFQIKAVQTVFPVEIISYFDIDPAAMKKFAANMECENLVLKPCPNITDAINEADLIITATAERKKNRLFNSSMIKDGVHIHAMGGDCPGKTELDPKLLERCRIIVEFTPQSQEEGEIQNSPSGRIDAELWEIVSGVKIGRENDQQITLFDSVGFALEDFSILRLIHKLTDEHGIGSTAHLIPDLKDPKNLYALLTNHKPN